MFKKSSGEMISVKKDQPVTYILGNNNSYTEYKTVTRTIKIHSYEVNQPIEPVIFTQKATIHRQVNINYDGTKTYGEW